MLESKSARIELRPKGEFVIITENGQNIPGRFSMYALNRFCKSAKITSYVALLQKLVLDMSIEEYCEFIMIATQDYHRKSPNTAPITSIEQMMDICDDLGGPASDNLGNLMKHAMERTARLKKDDDEADSKETSSEDMEDKKKERTSSTDLSSSNDQL